MMTAAWPALVWFCPMFMKASWDENRHPSPDECRPLVALHAERLAAESGRR